MNIIAQEAKKRQAVVKLANRKGKSYASRKYGVSLSSVNDGAKGMMAHGSHLRRNHTDHTVIQNAIQQARNS